MKVFFIADEDMLLYETQPWKRESAFSDEPRIRLYITNRLCFLRVLVCREVHRPGVHHGAGEQVGQLSAKGGRHCLVGWRERRGHEQRCGFRCRWDHVGGVNEEPWRRGGVGRHRVVDGCHAGGSSGGRRGLMQFGFELGFLSSTQKDKVREIKSWGVDFSVFSRNC